MMLEAFYISEIFGIIDEEQTCKDVGQDKNE